MSRALSLAVVGANYPNADKSNRKFEIMVCVPGDPVELRPEPKNKFDSRAVAVFSERGVQIGYLTAERAPWIGGLIKDGQEVRAIFQAAQPWGAYIRASLDGTTPALPPNATSSPKGTDWHGSDDVDFYPDEPAPDDFRDEEYPDD